MNYSASIIDATAPLKTSPAKCNLPANVVAMPGCHAGRDRHLPQAGQARGNG